MMLNEITDRKGWHDEYTDPAVSLKAALMRKLSSNQQDSAAKALWKLSLFFQIAAPPVTLLPATPRWVLIAV